MNRAPEPSLQNQVAAHALGWLLLGNSVGLLIAALLLWPELGRLLAPFTYGRWATVHLNAQLYGWCSVPLLGVLFRLFLPRGDERGGTLALHAWSGALLFSVIAWLAGEVSGKPFMEWRGLPRLVMPGAMLLLAAVLANGFLRRARMEPAPRPVLAMKGLFLAALAAVPPVLAWAASPSIYPVINPDSGGATGGSLLGSTLGIVALFLAFPALAGLPLARPGRIIPTAWVLLALHLAAYAALDHGHRSHHDPVEQVALFSLLLWWPLLTAVLRRYTWPAGSRRWLLGFAAWSMILLATALYTFLPGVLDQWKFTNALVAHTHIAMAGMLSCFLVLVLMALDPQGAVRAALARPAPFLLWHSGTLLMVTALLWLGTQEAENPLIVYYSAPAAQIAYALRLAAGVAMTLAAWTWFRATQSPRRSNP